jgi:hypothetical protein
MAYPFPHIASHGSRGDPDKVSSSDPMLNAHQAWIDGQAGSALKKASI